MCESLFCSGPWTGFYNYTPPDKHRMDLHLEFADGRIQGEGNDDVGRFLIQGRYNAAERECHWTKTYPGSHDVHYRGFREGKGIWGAWEIGLFARGGFHIWPRGMDSGENKARRNEADLPVEAPMEAVGTPEDAPVFPAAPASPQNTSGGAAPGG